MATPAGSQNHLELLATMSRNFAASMDIQQTLHQALQLICGYVQSEGGALFLLEGNELVCRACHGPVDIVGIRIGREQGIVGRCVSRNEPVIVRDVRDDPDFHQTVDDESGFTTRSILCAPMIVQERSLGAIELVNKAGADGLFSEPDLMMLETLSSSAALALTNARMQAELVEQEKVKRELELAADIQRSLLPPDPTDEDFPIRGINRPARTVSGDFYDFYRLPDGSLYFAIGDVSGKGMNAALLMSKTASLFRCLGKQMPEPGRLLARINAEICETAAHGMFVTMTIGRFDPATGRTVLANAGHEPALLLRGDASETLPAEFPPLGIVPTATDESLDETVVDLSGAQLFLYTDGITESPTLGGGEALGAPGVERMLRELAGGSLSDQVNGVIATLLTGPNQHDDLTLLAVDGRRSGA